ncbi:uncharacterized protein BJ212DRAFT_1474731 [Suillus subaureus]|uniref:CHAT domain-containing protein n=1 Tax=Suillus subaureus TaxID=48587 RepID=A0A9P7EQZ3_9AGAM|nr:uncharacterized protein BJ212DRAFT_1474731 [Suillus subaureus]KAG1827573.1 hypothetical protein BJ212DRAFT_1474731 [Suillus subaureus]
MPPRVLQSSPIELLVIGQQQSMGDLQGNGKLRAIIILTSRESHHVSLPSVALADLNNPKNRFARAIRHASIIDPKQLRNDLIVLLRTVWDEIILPIVNVFQQDLKLKLHSRIWLCPVAVFTSIPLHAAHPFRTNADRSKEPRLEGLCICSYMPTLSALVRSRQVQGKARHSWLSMASSSFVHKLVPTTTNHITISGDAATRASALAILQQDPTQPYNSHFVMKHEHLMLLDIMERNIPQAEFAFLLACHTAVGDEETPNEVIHLVAGLQFLGFKSVVSPF